MKKNKINKTNKKNEIYKRIGKMMACGNYYTAMKMIDTPNNTQRDQKFIAIGKGTIRTLSVCFIIIIAISIIVTLTRG